jgi:tripartite ATP-independent transporter DctP family solute receptor
MNMKKSLIILVIIFLVFLTACGSSGGQTNGESQAGDGSGKQIVLKLGHVGPADNEHPWEKYAKILGEKINENTNGQVRIETYPASQLGADREMLEGMQQGVLDMGLIGTIAMTNFVPEYSVWDLPYIFPTDDNKKYEIIDGPIGQELAAAAEKKGFKVLAYWHHSTRALSNSKHPVTKVEDMKSLKIRVVENLPSMDWFGRVAIPTPMAFNELYTALQQGTVDGQDNGPGLTYGSKFYEVQPYYTYTNHMYSVLALIVSQKTWEKLPDDIKVQLETLGKEVGMEQREYSKQMEIEYGKRMEAEGVQVTYLTDEELKRFQESARATIETLAPQIGGDLVNRMLEYKD